VPQDEVPPTGLTQRYKIQRISGALHLFLLTN
jgi:hypothetical protein